MSSAVICSNTAPIWHLAKIKEIKPEWQKRTGFEITTKLDIDMLEKKYGQILIPFRVQDEINTNRGCPQIAREFIKSSWVSIVPVKSEELVRFLLQQYMGGVDCTKNRGECETFALSYEQGLSCLLANDGAEEMFDKENDKNPQRVKYLSLIPFGDECLREDRITEDDFKNFLRTLQALGYTPKRHLDYFRRYNLEI